MPLRVICRQSKSFKLFNLGQLERERSAWSVRSGQLSRSMDSRQKRSSPPHSWRIPSSVTFSQCDNVSSKRISLCARCVDGVLSHLWCRNSEWQIGRVMSRWVGGTPPSPCALDGDRQSPSCEKRHRTANRNQPPLACEDCCYSEPERPVIGQLTKN